MFLRIVLKVPNSNKENNIPIIPTSISIVEVSPINTLLKVVIVIFIIKAYGLH